jgi:lipopolysaccharide/colanic/teichoic acid biosynthesis glycosyltransferase
MTHKTQQHASSRLSKPVQWALLTSIVASVAIAIYQTMEVPSLARQPRWLPAMRFRVTDSRLIVRREYRLKRLFDLVLAAFGLLVLAPVLIAIAAAIYLTMGRPVFFTHVRAGKAGRPFKLVKFRSMTDKRDAGGNLLPDAERITRLGHFLRRSSLDELPELFNVLRGEMSLVGPRPLLVQYLPLYTSQQMRRHNVRPGITGWAQINGRNAISWEKKFEHDVWYVDHQSLWLDVKILFLTVWQVLRRDGISQPGHATADFFRGSPEQQESAGVPAASQR